MLQQQNLRHEQVGAGTLILAPGADESYRIVDIRHFLATTSPLVGWVDRDAIVVLWRYVAAPLFYADMVNNYANPLHAHRMLNRLPGQYPIPIESGQIFTIPGVGANDRVLVIYDVYDAGDVKATEHNGTHGASHSWIQEVTYTGGAVWGTTVRFDTLLTPAQFLDFPIRANVPGGRRVTVEGIAGVPFMQAAAGAAVGRTRRVFWTRDRERILGEVGHGHWFRGEGAGAADIWSALESTIGHDDASVNDLVGTAQAIRESYAYTPPLAFKADEDVDLWCDTETLGAGAAITACRIVIMLALTEYRVGG